MSKPPPTPLALSPACLLRRQLIEPRRPCCPAASPAASAEQRPGLLRHQPITPGCRADDTADKRFACFAIAERHPVAQPGPPPPTPAAKPISSDPQHHPTFLGRSHPTRSTDPTPSVLSGCPPYPTTPFSASGPFAFAVFHTSPEFWMVLQFLAPVFDTRLEFWAVFPSPRPEKCLRTQTIEPLTWGFPIPSTTAPAIMASKPPRRFWTPHRSPHRRPLLPTSMPATARTIHMRRDFSYPSTTEGET